MHQGELLTYQTFTPRSLWKAKDSDGNEAMLIPLRSQFMLLYWESGRLYDRRFTTFEEGCSWAEAVDYEEV